MMFYMAGLLSVSVIFLGFVVDVGMMETLQLKLQNAADAAAVGAVYAAETGTSLVSAAAADAQLNGFVAGTNGFTLAVSNPPTSGPFAGNLRNVQVILTQTYTPRFFPTAITLTAHAVDALPPRPCTYFLSQYYTGFSLQANNESLTSQCTLYFGNSYNISSSTGAQFLLHGDIANSFGPVTSPISPAVVYSPALPDPLAYLAQPAFSACDHPSQVLVTGTANLTSGTYCGGININTSATVSLGPGNYIITGNLTINGPTLLAPGVTFIMTTGGGSGYGVASIRNVNATVSAPTSGPMQGILFFADRNMPPMHADGSGVPELTMQNWNPGSRVDGIFYLVGQQISVSNIPLKPINYLGLVVDYANIHNSGFNPKNDYSPLSNGNPFHFSGVQFLD